VFFLRCLLLKKRRPGGGSLFFIFSYIILGHLDDYIENIGIKYGIIKSNI